LPGCTSIASQGMPRRKGYRDGGRGDGVERGRGRQQHGVVGGGGEAARESTQVVM
jgi:hypothetical protein